MIRKAIFSLIMALSLPSSAQSVDVQKDSILKEALASYAGSGVAELSYEILVKDEKGCTEQLRVTSTGVPLRCMRSKTNAVFNPMTGPTLMLNVNRGIPYVKEERIEGKETITSPKTEATDAIWIQASVQAVDEQRSLVSVTWIMQDVVGFNKQTDAYVSRTEPATRTFSTKGTKELRAGESLELYLDPVLVLRVRLEKVLDPNLDKAYRK